MQILFETEETPPDLLIKMVEETVKIYEERILHDIQFGKLMFHVELEGWYLRFSTIGPFPIITVERLTEDEFLDSINEEKKTSDVQGWDDLELEGD